MMFVSLDLIVLFLSLVKKKPYSKKKIEKSP